MKSKVGLVVCALVLTTNPAWGGDTLDAAVGGAVGGAIGAAVGEAVGGRDGAIIGAGVGAAAGVAITAGAKDGGHHHHGARSHGHQGCYRHAGHHHGGHFCPPGQAKKGNC